MARMIFVSMTVLPLLAACAAFQASAAEVTTQQSAALEATCSKVMRLKSWQSEFQGCVSSLADSLAGQVRYDRASVAYHDCAQSGLTHDSPNFSRCVLDKEHASSSAAPLGGTVMKLDAAIVTPADTNPRDYFEASFDTRHAREEYACAQIGLMPDSGAFVSCVNNLDTDLFNIEHPPG